MNLTAVMVRKRIIAAEEADDARIDALRKQRREERPAEAVDNPLSRLPFLSMFRVRRTLVIP